MPLMVSVTKSIISSKGGKMKNVKQILSFALMGTLAFGANAYAEDSIRIVSWGGAYQKGQSIGIFQPAAKAMGITVKEDTYG